MTHRRTISLALPLAAAVALAGSLIGISSPVAADRTCTGTIGAETIDDNVVVPDGATCTLNGTTVDGNVLVGQGSALTVTGAAIDGNIQDDNNDAGPVTISTSSVGGNIQLEQGSSVTVISTQIGGDLQWESNDGALRAEGNTIGGNLQANQNTGGLTIVANTIDGNLQCQSNVPAPTGSGNVVKGSAEDQCAALTGPGGGGGTTPPPPSTAFNSVTPARLADTRSPNATVDGQFSGAGPVSGGSSYRVQVTGRGGVPTDVRAAVLSVTVVSPADAGFATVHPCDVPLPNASNINYAAGQAVPNAVIAALDADGGICIHTSATAHVIVDVSAYLGEGPISPRAPVRMADTRSANATTDGQFSGAGQIGAGTSYRVQVAGRGGVPTGASAAALNATIVEPDAAGFATLFPCDVELPNASNVNFGAGRTVANAVLVKLDADGGVCVHTSAAADLVLDVNASIVDDADVTPVAPARFADTRSPSATVDGASSGSGQVLPGQPLEVQIGSRGPVGGSATSAVLNVTIVEPSAAGFATVYPCDEAVPNASNLNFAAGQTVATAVIAKLDSSGRVCIATSEPAHVLVDVNAWGR